MGDGGKGSAPRPFSVDQDTFASNWDRVFGKKPKKIADMTPEEALQELADINQILGISDDYQNILSTEDCSIGTFNSLETEEQHDNT